MSGAKRAAARCVAIVLGLIGAYAVLPLRGGWWWLGAATGLVMLGATLPVAIRRLRAVLVSPRPVADAIEALVLLLAMLVTGFAAVYYTMNHGQDQFNGLDTRVDAVYFTITTMSTVGFGDIVASSQAARVVVTLNILINVVFVGVAVRAFGAVAKRGIEGTGPRR